MTSDEIKSKLNELGVDFPKYAKKPELEGLLAEAVEMDKTNATVTDIHGEDAEVVEPTELPENETGDTDSKRQSFTVRVTTPALNVRQAPDKTSDILRVVYSGEELLAVSDENGWTELTDGGFVMSEFVER